MGSSEGSRSPLRSGRRKTDIHRMSCAPLAMKKEFPLGNSFFIAKGGLEFRSAPGQINLCRSDNMHTP